MSWTRTPEEALSCIMEEGDIPLCNLAAIGHVAALQMEAARNPRTVDISVCGDCGSPDVELPVWQNQVTLETGDAVGSGDYVYCGECGHETEHVTLLRWL